MTEQNKTEKPSLLEIMYRYEEDDMTYKLADIDEIRAAIEAGADVNERDERDRTPMWAAAHRGYQADVVKLLIDHGADIHEGNPLVWKVIFRDTESVRVLIEAGADVNNADDYMVEEPPIAASCTLDAEFDGDEIPDSTEITRMLIAAGADIEARDYQEYTALLRAVQHGYEESANMLLDAGANIHVRDEYGNTPLLHAAYKCSAALVRRLLDAGDDIHARNYGGSTALLEAAQGGNMEVIHLLLERGANLHCRDERRRNVVMAAAEGHRNPVPAIKFFLSQGIDVNATSKDRNTALHLAADVLENGEVIRTLVAAGANIEAREDEGKTPTHIATAQCYDENLRVLIELGADIEARDNEGLTPLMVAAGETFRKQMKVLLAAGANVHARDHRGRTPLMIAAAESSGKLVELLLKAGADVNARDAEGNTTFIHAAGGLFGTETMAALIAAGANPHDSNLAGDSRAFIAAVRGEKHCSDRNIRYLVRLGLDVNRRDELRGYTPLMHAAECENEKAITALLAAGADVNAKNAEGKTALDIATAAGNEEITALLVKHVK